MRDLEERIRELAFESAKKNSGNFAPKVRLLEPRRGKTGIFQIVDQNPLAVDLGFARYLLVPSDQTRTFQPGQSVTVGPKLQIRRAKDTVADFFTYHLLSEGHARRMDKVAFADWGNLR